MRELVLDSRRLIILATIVATFAAGSGALTLLFADLVFQLEGERLVLCVTLGAGAGAVIGGVFGQPLFSTGLERILESPAPPMPSEEELRRWCTLLRGAVLQRRVQGARSQREQMLRGGTLMDLSVTPDLDMRPGRAGRPHVRAGGAPETFSRLVEHWSSAQGRLVILGDPGYGKTFAALALIGHIDNGDDHVAELFPLVDWHSWCAGREDPAIEDWLVDQLVQSYPQLSEAAAWAMIMQGRLIPVFDGLDEVPSDARRDCRDALEAYAGREAPFRSFVVTSRQSEYFALSPKWVGAERHVALAGLDREEIASVLSAGVGSPERWESVIGEVEAGNEQLVALLRSPLRLAAAIEAYESRDPRELLEVALQPDAGEELWNRLLAVDRRAFEGAARSDIRRWLSFIAASLQSHDRQRLWLHELYLYAAPADRRRFYAICAVLFGIMVSTPWLFDGTIAGKIVAAVISIGIVIAYRRWRDKPIEHRVGEPVGAVRYLKALPTAAGVGLIVGIGIAALLFPVLLVIFLISRVLAGETAYFGASALGAAATAGLSGLLFVPGGIVLTAREVASSEVAEEPPAHLAGRGPGAVIRATRNFALVSAGLSALLLAVPMLYFFGDSPAFLRAPLVLGLIVGWASGLDAWAYYHWTRWRLASKGLVPRRLRRFLDWASEDTAWLRASDAYEFRHRELLDYLARETKAVGAGNLSWAESPGGRRNLLARARSQARRADRLLRAEDFGAAADAYLAAADADPENARIRRAQAAAFEKLGEHEKQLEAASAAVALEPEVAENHTSLCIAHNRLGNLAAALESARRALELNPKSVQAHLNHAVFLGIFGRDEEELAALDEAISLDLPESDRLRGLRDELRERRRMQKRELKAAEKQVRRHSADPDAHWALARMRRRNRHGEGAEEARRRAVELTCENGPGRYSLGWELVVRGYAEDAVRVATARARDEASPERLADLAHALFDTGRVAEAGRRLKEAEDGAASSAALNSLANALIGVGRIRDAEEAAEQARREDPEHSAAPFTCAEAIFASGDVERARRTFSSLLEPKEGQAKLVGDPAWLCRILWDGEERLPLRPAAEMLVAEFGRFGYENELALGVLEATPTSARQRGWDPDRLEQWCSEWGRHIGLKRAAGMVQALAEREAA